MGNNQGAAAGNVSDSGSTSRLFVCDYEQQGELTDATMAKVNEVFHSFDVDGSMSIDKEEAVKHWKGKFGQLSAREFFNTVDANQDGKISLEEFVDFWKVVRAAGHSEEEINEELDNIKNGESWVGFNDLPKRFNRGGDHGKE